MEVAVLIFALLFAALGIVGALVGLGELGHPVGAHGVQAYGWGLTVNAIALAVYFLFVWSRHYHDRRT